MSVRVARCACGELQVELVGEPDVVVVCHCLECQRRTGSVFGVGAYFPRSAVICAGSYRTYSRSGSSGHALHFHFCERCGSTVFWELELRPQHIGVAVGAIGDLGIRAPARSVWEETRHSWVEFGCELGRHTRQGT
ncbi:MAG: GFA family protein [Gammaproteobacteria bacterium]|nr:GFA family protein [Gammaproteobacteria bacterium]